MAAGLRAPRPSRVRPARETQPRRTGMSRRTSYAVALAWLAPLLFVAAVSTQSGIVGREVAVARHLQDGEEFTLSTKALIEHGRTLFMAIWTIQEGGGRPQTKGTGDSLSDPTTP